MGLELQSVSRAVRCEMMFAQGSYKLDDGIEVVGVEGWTLRFIVKHAPRMEPS